jgi:hypothetical protein
MRLSELMSALGPTGLVEVALIIFLLVFFAIGVRVFWTTRSEHDQHAGMALDDAHAEKQS